MAAMTGRAGAVGVRLNSGCPLSTNRSLEVLEAHRPKRGGTFLRSR
jgi:hypothetical protein